jgi:threonine dehydratase
MEPWPTIEDVRGAAARIRPHAHRTPVVTCRSIDDMTGGRIFFKCENLQKAGAFKFRGACNTVMSLSGREARRGVATHSSGNHAAALTLAASLRGMEAHIVMPRTAPEVKIEAVRGYGARITFCEPTLQAREETLDRVVAETGATFVHPYNDFRVMAGQGTAALELLEDAAGLDMVMTPVGGGGLLSGTAITVSSLSPGTRIVAAEPEGADDAFRSLREGRIVPSVNPETIADGLLTSLGDKTFPVIRRHVERIVTVSDTGIVEAMRRIWERAKIVVEPSAAVTLAAILEDRLDVRGLRVGIILSGGNVDLGRLSELFRQ